MQDPRIVPFLIERLEKEPSLQMRMVAASILIQLVNG